MKLIASGIPAIIVDDIPFTPQLKSRDITLANRDSLGYQVEDSPTPSPTRPFYTPDTTFVTSEPSSPILGDRLRHSDISGAGDDSLHPHLK